MAENKAKPFWRDAAIAFGRITGWIAGPVVAAVLIGRELDEKYASSPRMLLISAGVALLVSIAGVAIEMKRYIRQVKREEEEKKNGQLSHDN